MRLRNIIAKILKKPLTAYLLLVMVLAVILAPIIFTAFTSFKTREETFRSPPTILPETPTLQAYEEVLFGSPIPKHLLNSVIVTVGTTIIVMVGGIFTAYGLSKYKFKGSGTVLLILLATRIIPPIALLIPFFVIMSFLDLLNTHVSLIVINTFLWFPFAVWMLKSFFDDFPQELIGAAMLDGCTRTVAFLKIVVPIASIGIAAVAIITFLWTWNEFVFAMLFTHTRDVQPITVGAFFFVGDELVQWDSIAATAIVAALPGLILVTIAQRAIVRGLTAGAVKG